MPSAETAFIYFFKKILQKSVAFIFISFYSYRPRKGTGLQNSEIARGQNRVRPALVKGMQDAPRAVKSLKGLLLRKKGTDAA
ncbi:MAG: hypothetical protein IJS37_01680 [Bacilli bacterium]|nr:hypothetical protein [Bacilli bacterium]